ncbi:2-keto-4-pentenoate hydratase, partial [Actinocorallia lasiicapitis]
MNVPRIAELLDSAARERRAVPGGSTGITELAEAYAVQDALVGLRVARGERVTGLKLGFTSVAKMRQMGVHDLIRGRITDRMAVLDGGEVPVAQFVHPRIEPEVAFLLGAPIGAGHEGDPLDVRAVAPALEIIDSRYEAFSFSLPEVIADNTSAAGYVLGAWRAPRELGDLGVLLEVDGRVTESGSTAAILGHPMRALAAAARLAAEAGIVLRPGEIV